MKIDTKSLSWLWTSRPGDAGLAAGALKWAMLLVNLPLFVVGALVATTGEVGLIAGGFAMFLAALMFVVLFPSYLVCLFLQKRRDGREEEAVKARGRKSRVHVGAGHYLHPDGRYHDQSGNEVPADDPRFKMLSKVGVDRMSDADLKAHLNWINRTHAGGGVFVHGDGRFSDPNWNELSPDHPRVREHLDKGREERN